VTRLQLKVTKVWLRKRLSKMFGASILLTLVSSCLIVLLFYCYKS